MHPLLSDENLPLMASQQSSNVSTPMASPTKSVKSNLSSKEIFRIANQSVDEFLNEIESKNHVSDISLPELNHLTNSIPHSPVTEPLHVEKNLLDELDDVNNNLSFDLNNNNDNDDDDLTTPIKIYHQLNGPKPQTQSPSKVLPSNVSPSKASPSKSSIKSPIKSNLSSPSKSPKKVQIDSSPIKIHNYEVDKEPSDVDIDVDADEESDDSTVSLGKQQQNLKWSKIAIKPYDKKHTDDLLTKLASLPSKPLPQIVPSKSDLSIKSMPNLDFLDLDSDDSSDLNIPQSSSATRLSVPTNRIISSNSVSSSSAPPFNQFYYDHDHYIQDMQSGKLVESKDIKSNKLQKYNLKKDLVESNVKPISETLKNNLSQGFQNENSELDRTSSVRSEMSISAADCKLTTKHHNLSLENVAAPKEDNFVKLNKNNDDNDDYGDNDNNDDIDSNNKQPNNIITLLHNPKQRSPLRETQRSSPLSIVGNVIGALVTGIDPDPAADDDLQQNEPILRKISLRNISTQSVATTVTDSGFFSASEGIDTT
ncbi:hypothetical protein C6P40_003072, partial [Pichia californica]